MKKTLKYRGKEFSIWVHIFRDDEKSQIENAAFCKQFKVPIAAHNLVELYDNCNAVYIASPHYTHYEYAKSALTAGKHVLCETPFVFSKDQAEEHREPGDERARRDQYPRAVRQAVPGRACVHRPRDVGKLPVRVSHIPHIGGMDAVQHVVDLRADLVCLGRRRRSLDRMYLFHAENHGGKQEEHDHEPVLPDQTPRAIRM